MDKLSKLRVLFLGGKQAGVIGLLTTIASGCCVKGVVTKNQMMKELASRFDLPIYYSVKQDEVRKLLNNVDLMISVHSREIIPIELLNIPRLGGINVHPCLKSYKGKDPIQRFLKDEATEASVGVHKMTEQVDMGETLHEIFVEIDRNKITTVDEVYNILYPIYSLVLLDVLKSEATKL
jgi:methionyl-tRNA formyltransferase